MRHWRALFLIVALAMLISGLYQANLNAQPAPKSYDPCNTEFHRSFPLAVSTAATTYAVTTAPDLIAPIVICSIHMTVPSASSCALVACDTGTLCTHQQNVTGAFGTGVIDSGSASNTIATVPGGLDLAYVSTGTGCAGVVSYVRGAGKVVPTVTSTQTQTPTATPT